MIQDLLDYEFLRLALLGTMLVSFLSALVSPIVVYRKMEFVGDGVAHATFAGLAIASVLSYGRISFALLASIVFSLAIWYLSKTGKFSENSAIGVMLPVFMAVGVLILSKSRNYTTDLSSYLFGNVLLINEKDIYFVVLTLIFAIVVYFVFWRDIIYYIADEKPAKFYGIKVEFISLLVILLVALSVVAVVKVSGIILMGAYIVMPGVFAKNSSKSFKGILTKSFLFSLLSSLVGFYLAYHCDFPPGPSIVVTSFSILLLSSIFFRNFN